MKRLILMSRRLLSGTLVGLVTVGLGGCGDKTLEFAVDTGLQLPESVEHLDFVYGGGGLVVTDLPSDGPDGGEAGTATSFQVAGRVRIVGRDTAVLERFVDFDAAPILTVAEDQRSARLELPPMPDGVTRDVDASAIVEFVLRAPPGLSLRLHSTAGRTRTNVKDHLGDVELLADGGGDFVVQNCRGHVQGSTRTGTVLVTHHDGSLDLQTGEGTLRATVDRIGERGVRLRSETPSLICILPENASFDLDARSVQSRSGKVGVIARAFDLPVEKVYSPHPEDEGRGDVLGHRVSGQVRGGGPLVDLEVQFGHLSVTEQGR